jgi:hypothetical protein
MKSPQASVHPSHMIIRDSITAWGGTGVTIKNRPAHAGRTKNEHMNSTILYIALYYHKRSNLLCHPGIVLYELKKRSKIEKKQK